MTNFHVGQLVVCVKSQHGTLEIGRIYTVRGFCTDTHVDGDIGILLEEADGRKEGEWCDCFDRHILRPVKTTSIEQFHKLVAPIKRESEIVR